MNEVLVKSKIDSLINCIARIESKAPVTTEKLANDLDIQDIVSINLERAVQLVVDICVHILSEKKYPIPKTMADAVTGVRNLNLISRELEGSLIAAIGFRNLAVHQYDKLDWSIVSDICTNRLINFKEFIRSIENLLA